MRAIGVLFLMIYQKIMGLILSLPNAVQVVFVIFTGLLAVRIAILFYKRKFASCPKDTKLT